MFLLAGLFINALILIEVKYMEYPFELPPITEEIIKLIQSKGPLTHKELQAIGTSAKEFIDWQLRMSVSENKLIIHR